ncbi:MAG: hypothetical protein H9W83_08865 [Leuconostoc sp.]|nr:hypothetical protein [Leuconostoc sp.]
MNCIYQTSEVVSNMITKTYLERMDQEGRVQLLLADQIAHVTVTPGGYFVIGNSVGEVFFIGSNGIKGVQRNLKALKPSTILVNGADYEAYRIENSALVYFVYIRRSKDRKTYFVAVEKTREGVHQDIKTFVGMLQDVQERAQRLLRRVKGNYYVHYVNEYYRLPGVQERQLLCEFEYDGTAIREALRQSIAEWKGVRREAIEERAAS